MIPDPINTVEHESWFPPGPPSYEQCVAAAVRVRAAYVVSPLAMAELFAWEDEDD